MAKLLISNTASLILSLSPPSSSSSSSRVSFKPPQVPPVRFLLAGKPTGNRGFRVVTTRAGGPTTQQYLFAFFLPLSLVAFTVFTSIRIADKLDGDYLEEVAINQAIRETDEDDEEEDMSPEEKPALPRTRNRPKRQV